ncbi:MAG TPA: sialidase family protein [Dehalococcoidia bacterium]|nr:sialidase family protein [Dehalococcoidia bacterium]
MRILASALVLGLLIYISLARQGGVAQALLKSPPLSATGLLSAFARENGITPASLAAGQTTGTADVPAEAGGPALAASAFDIRVNQDYSLRPQNETTIAVNPSSPNMLVGGANDYRLGNPVGAAFYTSFDGGVSWIDGFPPFPLLAGETNGHKLQQETPLGTGDPVVAFGRARAVPGGPTPGATLAYYAYLGVSGSFCEHGIFVSRSSNGLTWTQPVVPPFLPPGGAFTPVYWDKANDCSVFNDKPWLAVDRTNGPHAGRVYVTWSRFAYSHRKYKESPILMAYSDDNGQSWSVPLEVSGNSLTLCAAQVSGPPGRCDESQFSNAFVGPDGTLHVAFLNQQSRGAVDGFRNQYLVTTVNADTLMVSGPYKAADMIDGQNDYPVGGAGDATLCNSNFRFNSAGNVAGDPTDPSGRTLYLVFSDDRNGSSFSSRPQVTQEPADSFACPAASTTDNDIFLVKSTDGGVSWTNPADATAPPVRVNQDALRDGKDQWFPFVAVAPDGRVDVMFYDRRSDPLNRLAHVYLARSYDGGATWTETRVSSSFSNLNWAFDGGQFMGDYSGMAEGPDGTAYPFWTDARGGTPAVRQSDVYLGIIPP